jgi:hypothetical protein
LVVEKITLQVFAGFPKISSPSHIAIKPANNKNARLILWGSLAFLLFDARPNDVQSGGVPLPDG